MKKDPKFEFSPLLTSLGILVFFALAIIVTLLAPSRIDPSWTSPTSPYQVQTYEIADPNIFISTSNPARGSFQYVYRLKEKVTLAAFQESTYVRIKASADLEKYITKLGDKELKLTSKVLLLRAVDDNDLEKKLIEEWKKGHAHEKVFFPKFQIYELYAPGQDEAFAVTETDGIIEYWIDEDFKILDSELNYPTETGVIYVNNPKEYKVKEESYFGIPYWAYSENGFSVKNVDELKKGNGKFLSRKELIQRGEDIFRIEGCWYCHTDQTRTLVQDTVLNGSESFPAPPSTASEYIFQKVTFPGTRRIGPDLSRVGIKRPNRDWHASHFWSPKTESPGSIMPSFRHFFDNDPAGNDRNPFGIPNYQFEALYHYLMTKGTRITSPNKAWWLGKDPVNTLDIIEGRYGK